MTPSASICWALCFLSVHLALLRLIFVLPPSRILTPHIGPRPFFTEFFLAKQTHSPLVFNEDVLSEIDAPLPEPIVFPPLFPRFPALEILFPVGSHILFSFRTAIVSIRGWRGLSFSFVLSFLVPFFKGGGCEGSPPALLSPLHPSNGVRGRIHQGRNAPSSAKGVVLSS